MPDLDSQVSGLVSFLKKRCAPIAPITTQAMKRFIRIAGHGGNTALCFVAKEDHESKLLGEVKTGQLFYPASWSHPAKHARGKLEDQQSWDNVFTEFGMRTLKG